MKFILGLGGAWIFGCAAFSIAVAVGWVINIVHLIHLPVVLTGAEICRVVGIFVPPLGAIMGYWF